MPITFNPTLEELNALFPLGSKARVVLEQAVVEEFTKKLLPAYLNRTLEKEVERVIRALLTDEQLEAITQGAKEAVEKQFKETFGVLKLVDGAKQGIEEATRAFIATQLESVVEQMAYAEYQKNLAKVVETIKAVAPKYLEQFQSEKHQELVMEEAEKLLLNTASNIKSK